MKSKIKVITFLIIFLSSHIIFSQEKLADYNCSWANVIPGSLICEPVLTSYGFCIATDAKNLMGFSSNGILLWEKNIGRNKNISLTSLPEDFILFHNKNNNIIKLMNPSGSQLWSLALDFIPSGKVLAGRDGRFFLYGENKIACYGINGIRKWILETPPQKNIDAQELPDGSIIIFLEDEAAFTRGIRISPFGQMLENIIFKGSIKESWTCKDGVLLVFNDGSSGLFSIENKLSVNRWVTQVKDKNSLFCVKNDGSDFRLITFNSSELTIYKIDKRNGNVLEYITIKDINASMLKELSYNESGIFICDQNKAVLIGENFSEIWSALLPDSVKNNNINYTAYLTDDFFLLFNKNWSVNAYHTSQSTGRKSNNVKKSIHDDYSAYISLNLSLFNYSFEDSFFDNIKDPSIVQTIKKGDYGRLEEDWLSQTLSIARLYSMEAASSNFGMHIDKSVFSKDSIGFEEILLQLSLLASSDSQNAVADILSSSQNNPHKKLLIKNMFGYDPDSKIMDALEKLAENTSYKDNSYIISICDAVYNICVFMGRPAYNRKGREIIKNFMGPGFSSNIRNHARETLKKIISLEL